MEMLAVDGPIEEHDGDERDVNLSGGNEHILSNVDGNDRDEWK
jgi:hypothetical protein